MDSEKSDLNKEVKNEGEETNSEGQDLQQVHTHENGENYKWIEIPYWPEDVDKNTKLRVEELPKKKVKLFDCIKDGRLEDETREEYVIRRRFVKDLIKNHKKGKVFWHSTSWGSLTPQRAMEVLNHIKNQNQ